MDLILLAPAADAEAAVLEAIPRVPGGTFTSATLKSALHVRERLRLNGGGTILIDLGSKAPFLKRSDDLLSKIFGGTSARTAKGTRVVLVAGGEDASALADLARALDEQKLPWEVLPRPIVRDAVIELLSNMVEQATPAAVAQQAVLPDHGMESVPISAIEALRRGEFPLGAVPPVVAEVRRLVSDRVSSTQALADAVSRDPGLTAAVMRRSCSVAYGPGQRPRTVRQAISRTGALEVVRIAEGMLARSCYSSRLGRVGEVMTQAWRHTLARSVMMRFSQRFETSDAQERQYLLGLLADVGEGFLAKLILERGAELGEAERQVIADNHAAVGAALLESWNMNAECIDFARRHHLDVGSNPASLRLLCAASAAVGLGYPCPFAPVTARSLEEVGRVLGLHDQRDRDALKREIQAELAESEALL